jgi:uncharacterized protein (TIGR03067 family)
MKRFACAAAVLLAVVAVGHSQDEASKKDLHAMEGTWKVVVHEADGNKTTEEDIKKDEDKRLIVKAGKYSIYFGKERVGAGKIKLDATKTPKQVDVTHDEGPGKGMAMSGIYEIKGDTMRVCFAPPGKDRPKEFRTQAGSGQMLLGYKRIK